MQSFIYRKVIDTYLATFDSQSNNINAILLFQAYTLIRIRIQMSVIFAMKLSIQNEFCEDTSIPLTFFKLLFISADIYSLIS